MADGSHALMLAGRGAISTGMVLTGAAQSAVVTLGVFGAIALTDYVSYLTLAPPR